jgi:hypothetical protein
MARWRRILAVGALVAVGAASAYVYAATERWGNFDRDYDGRFTFVRLRWGGDRFRGGFGDAWNHDFPRAEQNLVALLKDLTFINANADGSLILTLDDPQLFRYPIVYMWEPGFWRLTDLEAERFGEYLRKGGFAIFDDFEEGHLNNLMAQMRRVIPEGRFVKIDETHRIFDSFFRMSTINFPHPMMGILPTYYAMFEDNDPTKRVMVIANHNNDVAEYWEWSGRGFFPVDTSNEAYKLGINYMLYGHTH